MQIAPNCKWVLYNVSDVFTIIHTVLENLFAFNVHILCALPAIPNVHTGAHSGPNEERHQVGMQVASIIEYMWDLIQFHCIQL